MDPTRLMNIAVAVSHMAAGTADTYGDEVLEATSTETTTCWLHQTARSELTVNANVQAQTWTIYLPPDVTLTGSDRLTVAGATYELDGPPHAWLHPRSGEATFIEATMRRVA